VRHHRFDALIGFVGGRVWGRQHTGGIEDIQSLVLHGAHVEVFYCDNHENIEIVLPTESLFVPAHGTFENVHGVVTLTDIVGFGKNLQLDLPASHRRKRVFQYSQITGHQGEKVAWLREWVFPRHFAPAIWQLGLVHQIAVRQQVRIALGIRNNCGTEFRQYIGTILVVRDFAKAFGLTLGAIHAAGTIQAFQRGIFLGANFRDDLNLVLVLKTEDCQCTRGLLILVRGQYSPIHGNGYQD